MTLTTLVTTMTPDEGAKQAAEALRDVLKIAFGKGGGGGDDPDPDGGDLNSTPHHSNKQPGWRLMDGITTSLSLPVRYHLAGGLHGLERPYGLERPHCLEPIRKRPEPYPTGNLHVLQGTFPIYPTDITKNYDTSSQPPKTPTVTAQCR